MNLHQSITATIFITAMCITESSRNVAIYNFIIISDHIMKQMIILIIPIVPSTMINNHLFHEYFLCKNLSGLISNGN